MFEPHPGRSTSKLCKKGESLAGEEQEIGLWAWGAAVEWLCPLTDCSPQPPG